MSRRIPKKVTAVQRAPLVAAQATGAMSQADVSSAPKAVSSYDMAAEATIELQTAKLGRKLTDAETNKIFRSWKMKERKAEKEKAKLNPKPISKPLPLPAALNRPMTVKEFNRAKSSESALQRRLKKLAEGKRYEEYVAKKAATKFPGVRLETYCLKQKKKTRNTNAEIRNVMVKGIMKYQFCSSCAECGMKKRTFLTKDKTGGII